jgi:glycosyltransferase involved in cell wall biosynthesis
MQTPDTTPFISVILPIRNEGRYIKEALDAVLAQDYPRDRMEVLVADGMSTDGTRDVVRSYAATHPCVRLIDNPGRIVATGLNQAMPLAKGEIIVRVDGHCVIAPDYVTNCVARLQEGVDGVGGSVDTIGETPAAQAIALAMSTRFGVGNSAFRTLTDKTMLVDTVPFPAYSRLTVERAGPYDEELVRNQDDEYNYRLRSMGAKILLAADVRSKYYSRSSLKSLWRQYYQYGYYKVRVMQKHPRQMQPRQFVPPVFAATLLALAALSPLVREARLLLAAIVGLYAIVNLTVSAVVARSRGLWSLPLLAAAYATLHLSFGCGFLVGCVRFRNRWGHPVAAAPRFGESGPSVSQVR